MQEDEPTVINQHTLDTLEFGKDVESIHGQCLTAYGHDEVDLIQPMFDKPAIDRRQIEIVEMMDIFRFGTAFPLYNLDDCREQLSQSTLEGTFLDPKEILVVLELIEVSISINQYDKDERDKFPTVAEYLPKVRAFPELRKEIRRAIDEEGFVKDNASSALKQIRTDLRESKRRIITRLEGILSAQHKQAGWQDDVFSRSK